MKKIVIFLQFVSMVAFAQTVEVEGIPAQENTTIEVRKGSSDRNYDIVNGENDVEGDPSPLLNDAKTSWKKACADWKTEIKDLNKENSILSLNCGKMRCASVAMETTCESKGTYKIKTKVR